MAYQSPMGMQMNNGGNNGGDGGQSNQPQGTEYTLQGEKFGLRGGCCMLIGR